MWLFVLTIVFGLAATWWPIPGLGSYEGELRLEHQRASTTPRWRRPTQELAPLYAQFYARRTAEELAGDPKAMAIGERLFMNNCAQCHGSDARGSKGFPEPDRHATGCTAARPRRSSRPSPTGAHGADAADGRGGRQLRRREEPGQLRAEPVGQPARFGARGSSARASSRPAPPATASTARATRRWARPTSTDDIWLHGWGEQAIIAMINSGKTNDMPAQAGKLTEAQIQVLAAYVWGLSNKPSTLAALTETAVQSFRRVARSSPSLPVAGERGGRRRCTRRRRRSIRARCRGMFARWRWAWSSR